MAKARKKAKAAKEADSTAGPTKRKRRAWRLTVFNAIDELNTLVDRFCPTPDLFRKPGIDYAIATLDEMIRYETKATPAQLDEVFDALMHPTGFSVLFGPGEHIANVRPRSDPGFAVIRSESKEPKGFLPCAWVHDHRWRARSDSAMGLRDPLEVRVWIGARTGSEEPVSRALDVFQNALIRIPPNRFPSGLGSPELTHGLAQDDLRYTVLWLLAASLHDGLSLEDRPRVELHLEALDLPIVHEGGIPTRASVRSLFAKCRQNGVQRPVADALSIGMLGNCDPDPWYVPIAFPRFEPPRTEVCLPAWTPSTPWCCTIGWIEWVKVATAALEFALSGAGSILPRDLVTKAEAARLAKVKTRTIYRWLEQGFLKTHGQRDLVSEADVRRVSALPAPARRPLL